MTYHKKQCVINGMTCIIIKLVQRKKATFGCDVLKVVCAGFEKIFDGEKDFTDLGYDDGKPNSPSYESFLLSQEIYTSGHYVNPVSDAEIPSQGGSFYCQITIRIKVIMTGNIY